MSSLISQLTVTHLVDVVEIPARFDLLDRFGVVMDSDTYPIDCSYASGYITLHVGDLQVGVWYYKLIDGLFGPTRTHLANIPGLFRELVERLKPYVVDGVSLGKVVIRGAYVPHLSMTPETPNDAITLF